MQASLQALSEWIAGTSLSDQVKQLLWIVPLMQTIHILGVATVMGTIVLIDLRVLGTGLKSQSVDSMVRRYMPIMWTALVVLLITGSVLVIGEPNRSVTNPAFETKMVMLIIVSLLTAFLTGKLKGDADFSRAGAAKLIAVVSLVIWTLIVFAGRWIAYIDLG